MLQAVLSVPRDPWLLPRASNSWFRPEIWCTELLQPEKNTAVHYSW